MLFRSHKFYGAELNENISELAFEFWDEALSKNGLAQDNSYIIADVSDMFEEDDITETAEPLIICSSDFPSDTKKITFTFNTASGNRGLIDYTDDIYAHTGITVNGKPWQYDTSWSNPLDKHKLQRIGDNKWQLNITGGIRNFFGVKEGETVERIWFVLRNKAGNKEHKTELNTDIYYDLYPDGLYIKFNQPSADSKYKAGESVSYSVSASQQSDITIKIGDQIINTIKASESISGSYTFTSPGTYTISATAIKGSLSANETNHISILSESNKVTMPEGLSLGVNYHKNDNSKVTLALNAPYKSSAYVIGDFNDWSYDTAFQMKRDGDVFWLEIEGLTPATEYAYQFVIDGSITIADPYTHKILDPDNDKYITADVYPGLKSYPDKAKGIVSVMEPGKKDYKFNITDFRRPAPGNLIIYEMLIRDFTKEGTYTAAAEKIDYLKTLGVNAVELMPVNEFEGNDSWGYNPSFYFAPDKAYGSDTDLKMFIDKCHENGIAVIIDMVLNHSFSQSPLLSLYKGIDGNPLNYNPWYNETSNIQNSDLSWGYDFNHESIYTRRLIDDINSHWIKEYNIDGFRFDFTKGFSNTTYLTSTDKYANAYDAARISNLKRMKDAVSEVSKDVYFICEHLTGFAEEKELGEYGIMLWKNMNHSYQQAAMGWQNESDFSYLFDKGIGMPDNSLVGYMESHDEERLGYKSYTWGQESIKGDKNLANRLKQNAACVSMFLTIPGPKMIWQFGELGYEVSIDYNGRTGKKPVKWEYLEDNNRLSLFMSYSKIISLRATYPQLFSSRDEFSQKNGFSLNVKTSDWETGRFVKSKADGKVMIIAANLSCKSTSLKPEFTSTGTWHEYITESDINVSDTNMSVYMPAYSYKIYLNFKPELTSNNETILLPDYNPGVIYGAQRKICFYFEKSLSVSIHDMSGRLISDEIISEGYSEKTLDKGIYIVNNRKVVVY